MTGIVLCMLHPIIIISAHNNYLKKLLHFVLTMQQFKEDNGKAKFNAPSYFRKSA